VFSGKCQLECSLFSILKNFFYIVIPGVYLRRKKWERIKIKISVKYFNGLLGKVKGRYGREWRWKERGREMKMCIAL